MEPYRRFSFEAPCDEAAPPLLHPRQQEQEQGRTGFDEPPTTEHAPHSQSDDSATTSARKDITSTGTPTRWAAKYSTTILTIVGLFFLSLLCSISHYVFFVQLHGTAASGDQAIISQSYVTTISLVLVTLFKAALIGSIGLCSAQCLWRTLRGKARSVSTVESMFQMRHNLLELANPRVMLSRSFLIAVYMWLVPLAAVYPPGALTITSKPQLRTESVHMSVLEPPIPDDFNAIKPLVTPLLAFIRGPSQDAPKYLQLAGYGYDNMSISYTTSYDRPRESLIDFTRYVVSRGEILEMPPPPSGENSSYTVTFMGPQLSCTESVKSSNETAQLFGDITDTYQDLSLGESDKHTLLPGSLSWPITQNKIIGALNCVDTNGSWGRPDMDDENVYLIEKSAMSCSERYVLYTANFTYVKGVRSLRHTMEDMSPQPSYDAETKFIWKVPDVEGKTVEEMLTPPIGSPEFAAWRGQQKEHFWYWNSFAILASFLGAISGTRDMDCSLDYRNTTCTGEWLRSNETVAFGPPGCIPSNGSRIVLDESALNPHRFDMSSDDDFKKNENRNLNITESSLNELLTNITISLLTLHMWTQPVTVNSTEYRNMYHFSRPLNLILPYSLCLGIGLVIVTLGLLSMWQNGVPATDGGFVQVMMATRGRTEMESFVLRHGLANPSALCEELKHLRIRYGELVIGEQGGVVDVGKRYGFGTMEETISLRRRK